MIQLNNKLKDGLAGILRVRDEGQLIEGCIDSCIDSLDELIVMCYDCTDDTPEILERKVKQYPDKLKVFYYNHHVLSYDLSSEEFDEALALPEDSIRLYSTMCNFGLMQSHYKYMMKIDADQLYFSDELKRWRDICAGETVIKWHLCFLLGYFFMFYFSLYRRLSSKLGKVCSWMLPNWIVKTCRSSYWKLAAWKMLRGTASVAVSGINLFKDDDWYVPFDTMNHHLSYNGTGDTVIFKLTNETYFARFVNPQYMSVTDSFSHPYKIMYAGTFWYHLHANRRHCYAKVKQAKDKYPALFVSFNELTEMKNSELCRRMGNQNSTLFARILYLWIHINGRNNALKYAGLLNGINKTIF